jgi:hypothetical protein
LSNDALSAVFTLPAGLDYDAAYTLDIAETVTDTYGQAITESALPFRTLARLSGDMLELSDTVSSFKKTFDHEPRMTVKATGGEWYPAPNGAERMFASSVEGHQGYLIYRADGYLIDFSFDVAYYMGRVAGGYNGQTDFKVLISPDNGVYTELPYGVNGVAADSVSGGTGGYAFYHISKNPAYTLPAGTRYLKILYPSDNAPGAGSPPFNVANPRFTYAESYAATLTHVDYFNGDRQIWMLTDGSISASLTFANELNEEKSYDAILAVYNDKALVAASRFVPFTAAAHGVARDVEIPAVEVSGLSGAGTAKLFVWERDTIAPALTQTFTIGQ